MCQNAHLSCSAIAVQVGADEADSGSLRGGRMDEETEVLEWMLNVFCTETGVIRAKKHRRDCKPINSVC